MNEWVMYWSLFSLGWQNAQNEQLRARGTYSGSQLKDTVHRGGKAWWQEDEAAAGHSASSVRMKRER